MPKRTEARFEASFGKALDRIDCQHLNIHGHAFQRSGWPDHFIAHRSFRGFVEFKVPGGRESSLQEHRRWELCSHGMSSYLILFTPEKENSVRTGTLEIQCVGEEVRIAPSLLSLEWNANDPAMGVKFVEWMSELDYLFRHLGTFGLFPL